MKKINQKRAGMYGGLVSGSHTRETKLDEINRVINWGPIEERLQKQMPRNPNAVGNPAYPAIIMFKCLILQRLYNLSDAELSDSLADRFSFLRFVGLRLEDSTPDASTVCRFRNALLKKDLSRELFAVFLDQLRDQGLSLKEGIAVDASLIQSSRPPRTVLEEMPVDRAEPDLQEGQNPSTEYVKVHSDDKEAAWVKKAGKSHYGYKVHAAVAVGTGIILGGHVTPANRSDMTELPKVLAEVPKEPGSRCYADKGYASAANRSEVCKVGLKDGIMDKAVRNKPLSFWQKIRNKLISGRRFIVERAFGDLKRNRRLFRSRYVGMAKVEQEFFLVAFAANGLRMVTLSSGPR